jgi:hypothetical protein
MEHTCDEIFKASAYMSEVLTDPIRGHSEDPAQSPLSVCERSASRPPLIKRHISVGIQDEEICLGMD